VSSALKAVAKVDFLAPSLIQQSQRGVRPCFVDGKVVVGNFSAGPVPVKARSLADQVTAFRNEGIAELN
jgi:hypothetical protein